MPDNVEARSAARAWIRREQRAGQRPARPVIALGLLGTVLSIAQAFCAASVLTGTAIVASLAGFAVAALLRAGSGYAAERAGFAAGAGARRRLRTDIVTRLARARPLLAHARHSAELAAVVVDRIEALEGLFARFIPATTLAVAAPAHRCAGGCRPGPDCRTDPGAERCAGPGRNGVLRAWRGRGGTQPVPRTDPTAGAVPGSHPRHCHHRHARPRRG